MATCEACGGKSRGRKHESGLCAACRRAGLDWWLATSVPEPELTDAQINEIAEAARKLASELGNDNEEE